MDFSIRDLTEEVARTNRIEPHVAATILEKWFDYMKTIMESEEAPPIRLQYFGVFRIKGNRRPTYERYRKRPYSVHQAELLAKAAKEESNEQNSEDEANT